MPFAVIPRLSRRDRTLRRRAVGRADEAGPIIHPPLIVMKPGRWSISSAGTFTRKARSPRSAASPTRSTPSVSGARRLGHGGTTFSVAHHYAREGENQYGRGSHDRLTDSGDWREQLVLRTPLYVEDSTRIVVPDSDWWSSPLGSDATGKIVPRHRRLNGLRRGFRRNGRTLASLGLGDLRPRPNCRRLLREGTH